MHQRVDAEPEARAFLAADRATCLAFYGELPATCVIERHGFLQRAAEATLRLAEMDEDDE